jgi:Arc/MetJ-type ribon-helix-helix transcriptional regulator
VPVGSVQRVPGRLAGHMHLLTLARVTRAGPHGMAIGMASKKVTITLPDGQLEAVRKLVESGAAQSLSGFIQHAVGIALGDVTGWRDLLGQALERTGGPLTKKERAWADGILKARPGSRRRRSAA